MNPKQAPGYPDSLLRPDGARICFRFSPATEEGGVGGFDWFPADAKREALAAFDDIEGESKKDFGHVVRLVEMEVKATDRDEITEEIEERLGKMEDTLTALEQYLSSGVDVSRVPSGGVVDS